MLRMRFSFLVPLLAPLLFVLAGSARSLEPQEAESKSAVDVVALAFEPEDAQVGDEITVTVAIRNNRAHLVLVNVRLLTPPQVVPVIPDVEQVLFLEGNVNRDVKWRAKIVGEGGWRIRAGAEAIREGWPLTGSRPDLSAEANAALAKNWAGTWSSQGGFIYDAEMQATLQPSGAVAGRIHWTLKTAPDTRSDYADKVGKSGVEYVWGNYDPQYRHLYMEGYRRDDPHQILGLDKYRLTLSEDYDEIKGATWNHGTWEAAFSLVAK